VEWTLFNDPILTTASGGSGTSWPNELIDEIPNARMHNEMYAGQTMHFTCMIDSKEKRVVSFHGRDAAEHGPVPQSFPRNRFIAG
jgi:uncharacterized Zn-binding protein involved in type VI secretion